MLDAACGTGVVARLAAGRVGPDGRVVGLDLNPGMLAVAAGLPVEGAPIGWVQADAGRLPFGDRSFEVVCCQLGLQYVPDRPATLAGMARVLVPGGRLAARRAGEVRFGSAREFLLAQGSGSPLAGPIGAAGPEARAALLEEMEGALVPWQGPAGLAFPIEALLVGARG